MNGPCLQLQHCTAGHSQLQLKTDSAQHSADCRVIKAEMAVFTRGEQAYRYAYLLSIQPTCVKAERAFSAEEPPAAKIEWCILA